MNTTISHAPHGGADNISAVVFDVGGVLIDWDPEYLYRKLIPDDSARAWFLGHVCPRVWNAQQDLGLRSWAEAVAHRTALYPDHADLIHAYDARWPEMVSGGIAGTVALKAALRAAGVPVYAITNYSAEKWDISCDLYPFLREFDGLVVSGREKMIKPDPAIYTLLCRRYGLNPAQCLFIDDLEVNVAAAKSVGMHGHVFTDPASLAHTLGTTLNLKLAA